jgi:hypothetical protein
MGWRACAPSLHCWGWHVDMQLFQSS